ncbi:MAG: DMT family transporter [Oceanococcaceae bacterium]
MQETNIPLGVRHAIVAALGFSIMGALIKLAATELSTPVITFLRNLFGLVFLLPVLARAPWQELKTTRPGLHLLRTVVGLVAMYSFFFAIARIPLAEAMLLNYAAPLYVPLIAWLWLKERPARGIGPLVLLGLVGVGFIVQPQGTGVITPVSLIAVMAGVFAGWAFVTIRKLSATEPAPRIVFWFGVFSVLLTALPAWWFWEAPSLRAWLLMLGVGLFATVAQISLTRAYALIPAAQAAPLNYLVVVFSMIIGWLFWDETLGAMSFFGAALVVGSSVLAVRLRR